MKTTVAEAAPLVRQLAQLLAKLGIVVPCGTGVTSRFVRQTTIWQT